MEAKRSERSKEKAIIALFFAMRKPFNTNWLFVFSAFLLCSCIEPNTSTVPFNCESCVTLPNRCGPNNEQGVLLTGHIVATNIVSVDYNTPLANNPELYQNWMGLWEGNYINYNKPPLERVFIEESDRCSSYAFDSVALEIGQDYIVGYGVGDEITSVAATLLLPWELSGFKPGKSTRTIVSPTEIGDNYVVVNYCTPVGNDPQANHNWMGIQKGTTFTYQNNRFRQFEINSTEHKGDFVINNYPFEQNEWYTIVYGTASEKEDIAASWTFMAPANKSCSLNCPKGCGQKHN